MPVTPITVTASPTAVATMAGGSPVTATVTASPANGGTIAYSKGASEAWITLSGGTVTFAPAATVAAASYPVTITATETYTDASGASQTVTANVTITVAVSAYSYTALPITITTSMPTVSVTAGSTSAGTATVSATARNNGTITYSKLSGPSWATLSGSTVTFAPDASVAAGTYAVVIRATETFTIASGVTQTTTSDITINAEVAPYVIPDEPVDEGTNTGDDETKTVEAPVAVTTETKTTTIVQTTVKQITIQTFGDVIVAAQKIVSTLTAAETKQTVTETTNSSKVETTVATTQAATTALQTTAINTETGAIADTKSVATSVISAVTTASTETKTDDTSVAVKTALASSLMLGSSTATEGNLSNITSQAKTKEDGTLETPGETLLRIINEALDAVADTFASETTKQSIAGMVANGDGSVTIEVKETSTLQSVSTTKTVTNADGTTTTVTNEETYQFTEVMSMLAAQAAQSGTDSEQAEIAQEVPAAVMGTVEAPDPGVYTFNTQHKPDTWGKKVKSRAHKNDKRVRGAMQAAALDANEVGSSVVLNSLALETDHIPAENEWVDGKLVIPGYTTIAMYLEPGVEVTPILTIPAEEAAQVEGISTSAQTEETVVVETKTVTIQDVPVYVASNGSYSTSFDAALNAYFEEEGYNTTIGYFVVPGETYTVNTADNNNMLARTNRAVVQTLPMLNISGDYAGDVGAYVMKVRYDIPVDTETRTISSADEILEFWPEGLIDTDDEGNLIQAAPGEAIFLDSTGRAPLTAATIRAVAKKQAGVEVSDTTWGYDGYIVMMLNKLDDDDPYTPVITVKTEAVTASETPGGETPGGETPGGETPGGETPATSTLGSSGGGCDAGFGALALAVLAGFIAARKK